MKINNRRDVLLLLLYSPGKGTFPNEPIVGRTRIVKMLFLFKEEVFDSFRHGIELTKDNFYEFFPWHYGPFSKQVYEDIMFFELRGFIDVREADEDPELESIEEWATWADSGEYVSADDVSEYAEEVFRLTDKGAEFTEKMYVELNQNQKNLLKEFKVRITNVPLRSLLHYVYSRYPGSTDRSKIKGDVLGNNAQ